MAIGALTRDGSEGEAGSHCARIVRHPGHIGYVAASLG